MTQEEFHLRYQYSPTKDCLGEGGFGKVFKAYDNHLDKWVAIKMVEVKSGLEHVRLKHEVEIVNKLPTHQNIARYEECYTFSSFTGEYDFAVLQYYESGNLQQLLETKQLTEQQKDSILRQILAGIEFLHNQGIIHRDLKPQNILIVNRDGEYIPKITDFGISKKLDTNKSSVFTNSLAGVGTLAYASPEQLRGLTIKKNTDLWSFGVIVCYVFLSRLPFNLNGQSITNEAGRHELYIQIANGELDSSVSQLSINWQSLVRKCIIVNIEDRVETVAVCFDILGAKQYYGKEVSPTIVTFGKVFTELSGIFLDYIYDYLGSFIDGLAIVKRNGLSGFINKLGIEVIPCQFDSVDEFRDGLACVKRNGKYGFIDKNGKEIISCEHAYSGNFSEDFCPIYPSITSNNPDYILDKAGRKLIFKDKFDEFSHFHDGLARVSVIQTKFLKKTKMYGYVNKEFKLLSLDYGVAHNYTEGLAIVSIGEVNYSSFRDYGIINCTSGESVIDKNGIERISSHKIGHSFGYYGGKSGGVYGGFSDGMCIFKRYGDWPNLYGYIDNVSNIKIQAQFDEGYKFKNGIAKVVLNNTYCSINKEGQILGKGNFEKMYDYSEGLAVVRKNNKLGFVDKNMKEVISCKYDQAVSFSDSLAAVCLNNEWFYIDQTGERISFYK